MRHSRPSARLYANHRDAVLALFKNRGFNPWESEDLAQETFLKAHQKLATYRGDAPVEHWLFRIASNTARATRRFDSAARRAAPEVSLDHLTSIPTHLTTAPQNPLHTLLDTERSDKLYAAVNRLPRRMRCCVLLLLKQDLTYGQIAGRLGISEQTVKVQLLRARGQLKALLRQGSMDW